MATFADLIGKTIVAYRGHSRSSTTPLVCLEFILFNDEKTYITLGEQDDE